MFVSFTVRTPYLKNVVFFVAASLANAGYCHVMLESKKQKQINYRLNDEFDWTLDIEQHVCY